MLSVLRPLHQTSFSGPSVESSENALRCCCLAKEPKLNKEKNIKIRRSGGPDRKIFVSWLNL